MSESASVSLDSAEPERPPTIPLTSQNLDAINLDRALIDFEIANARVIELTTRLTELSGELLRTRSELGLAQLSVSELTVRNQAISSELADLKSGTAYRTARFLGDVRAKALRR